MIVARTAAIARQHIDEFVANRAIHNCQRRQIRIDLCQRTGNGQMIGARARYANPARAEQTIRIAQDHREGFIRTRAIAIDHTHATDCGRGRRQHADRTRHRRHRRLVTTRGAEQEFFTEAVTRRTRKEIEGEAHCLIRGTRKRA